MCEIGRGSLRTVRRFRAVTGHLFVVHGDLTAIACDAILVPTDRHFNLTESWDALELERPAEGWNGRLVIPHTDRPGEPQVWLGNIGQAGTKNDFVPYGPAVKEFVKQAAQISLQRDGRIYNWPKIRLALNVVGSGEGGGKKRRGDLLLGLIQLLEALATKHDVDIVLAAYGDKLYAGAQRARRQMLRKRISGRTIVADDLATSWKFDQSAPPDLSVKAQELAKAAMDNSLVLFIGAGVSAGAGIPTWRELLDSIAHEGRVHVRYRKLLESRDPRDAATLIDRKIHPPNSLRPTAAELIASYHFCSLQHALLASLRSTEAVSTNFDQLFEVASRVAEHDLAVLPTHPEKSTTSWLLKLHGSVDDPPHMVLTRSDYLDMPRYHGALMGLVQGLLLTRHMMYVGYSLSDEDFHELVHEVRAARGSSGSGQATMLTLDADQAQRDLWEDDLEIITMTQKKIRTQKQRARAARQLEIFLDLLGFLSTTSAAFFLDPAYDTLSIDEGDLRWELTRLAKLIKKPARDQDRVAHQVKQFLNCLDIPESSTHKKFTRRITARDLDAERLRFPSSVRDVLTGAGIQESVAINLRGTLLRGKWRSGLPDYRCPVLELQSPATHIDRVPLRSLVGLGERLAVTVRASTVVLH